MEERINNLRKALEHKNAGFIYAIIGAIAEANSVYYLNANWSALGTPFKQLQGILLAIFFSGGLLFFILRSNKAVTELEKLRALKIANGLAWFGAITNLMYVFDTIYLTPSILNQTIYWNKLIYAFPFAIALPIILKLYASEKEESKYTPEDQENIKTIIDLKNKLESGFNLTIRGTDYEAKVK